MKIVELKILPKKDSSHQRRMLSNNGYVDFSLLKDGVCAHTWHCPGEGRIFLRALEKYADEIGTKVIVPTVLNAKLRNILIENGYSKKYIRYMDDAIELWEKASIASETL